MTTVAVLLLVAAAGAGMARGTRFPLGPLVLAAGIVASVLPLPMDTEVVREVLVLSGTFLVFSLGAALDVRVAARRSALVMVAAEIGAVGVIAVGASVWLGLDAFAAAYVGLAVAASSSLAAIGLLRKRERLFEPSGRLLVNVLLFQDLVVLSLLAVVVGWGDGAGEAGRVVAGVLLLGLLAYGAARWLVPRVLVGAAPDDERQLLFVLALLSIFLGIAKLIGTPTVAGAFFAGLALAPFPAGGIVRGQVDSFQHFFVPLFYAALGAVVRLPSPSELTLVFVLLGSMYLVLPAVLVPLARRAGLTGRAAVEGAMMLATCGELSLVVGLEGLARGHLGEGAFRVIAAVALVTMGLLPLATWEGLIWRVVHLLPGRRRAAVEVPTGHLIVIGCGAGTLPVIEALRDAGVPLVGVDDDPEAVARVAKLRVPVLRGDGSTRPVLERAGLAHARAIVSTMRGFHDNARLIRLARRHPVLVRVFSQQEGDRIRALGAETVVSAEAATEAFVDWYRARRSRGG